jgi:DNA-binding PadR family transcriptional regulator
MYKQALLLGLLMEKPMYGQQIRELIEHHHDLFADYMKKPTIYYQLDRLVQEGYLEVRREQVEAPGPGGAHSDLALRERDVYYITEEGRRYFSTLLRTMLKAYTPDLSDIDAGLFFLHHIQAHEAIALLSERLHAMSAYRETLLKGMQAYGTLDSAHQMVHEHKLMLLDAELRWLHDTIERLKGADNVSSLEK